jgi:nucleoside-diphosphate-sugar epimerase
MQKVLVVGGAGYTGGVLVDRLVEAGHDVRVYDNLLYETEYRKPIDFVFGDVRDQDRLSPQLSWADVVVWLAAIVGDGACAANPDLAVEINRNRVEWLANNYDGRIIFMSTCSVYGVNDDLLDENAAVNPLSVYATTKLQAEPHIMKRDGLIFRLGTLYGISDAFSRIRMDLVVNMLTARAFFERRISIFGGNQYRPLLHVGDVAEAIVANIDSKARGAFNLHAVNTRMRDLAEQLRRPFPDLKIDFVEMAFQDNRNYRVSSEKAREAFGFAPQCSVDDGIDEVKTLLEQGRIKDIGSPRYSNSDFIRSLYAREG